jgi:DNA gyrase/topoisomerase IV subunit B
MAAKEYGAESIKVLEGLEAVRRRPRNVYWINFKRGIASFSLGSN